MICVSYTIDQTYATVAQPKRSVRVGTPTRKTGRKTCVRVYW